LTNQDYARPSDASPKLCLSWVHPGVATLAAFSTAIADHAPSHRGYWEVPTISAHNALVFEPAWLQVQRATQSSKRASRAGI